MPRVRVKPVGGRGQSVSLDLTRKFWDQGLSDQQVREKLKARGFKKSRIAQLIRATSANGMSIRKGRSKSFSASQDLVKKLVNQGLCNERVRSRLKLRGFGKSRISQLMKPLKIKSRMKSLTNGSVNSKKGQTKRVRAAVPARKFIKRVQAKRVNTAVSAGPSIKRVAKKDNHFDFEKLIEAEMFKRAPACAPAKVRTDRKNTESMPKAPSAMARNQTTKCLKRTSNSKGTADDDVDNLVRAHMMKASKRACISHASIPVDVRSVTGASVSDEKEALPIPEELAVVVNRIIALRRDQFASTVDWAFAILCQPARDVRSVQRAYRAFMRRLHPDKAGTEEATVAAVELLREATTICEKALSQQRLPNRPTQLKFDCLCAEPGMRKIKISWTAPKVCQLAPAHKYIVAVLDPSFGEVLTIATLEADYSQELRRYIGFDHAELCSHVISEEHLRKMPKLFKADSLTVHVASGNREGQSEWNTLKICLKKLKVVSDQNFRLVD